MVGGCRKICIFIYLAILNRYRLRKVLQEVGQSLQMTQVTDGLSALEVE